MKKKTLLGLVVLLTAMLAGSAYAQPFSTRDFAGSWYVYSIEVDPLIPAVYWLRGEVESDESGNLAGTYYAPDGSSVTLSSGQLALDHKGIISGSFTAASQTATVVHGKMDQNKTCGASVFIGTDGTMDIATFIKDGGTFSTSDLEGTWYGYITLIDATLGAVFWVRGTNDIDSSGGITGGTYTGPDGTTTLTLKSGALQLDSQGILTGHLELSGDQGDQTVTIVHGKIDQGKTKVVAVSVEANGNMALAHLIKAGGTFQQSDAAGAWYAYGLNIDPSIPAVYWVYGNVRIDASGNFAGTYFAPTGESVGGTGTASMDNAGVVTGTVAFETGDSGFVYFKQDQSKTNFAGVSVTMGGVMGIWQFFKESYVAMPGTSLLLLDD